MENKENNVQNNDCNKSIPAVKFYSKAKKRSNMVNNREVIKKTGRVDNHKVVNKETVSDFKQNETFAVDCTDTDRDETIVHKQNGTVSAEDKHIGTADRGKATMITPKRNEDINPNETKVTQTNTGEEFVIVPIRNNDDSVWVEERGMMEINNINFRISNTCDVFHTNLTDLLQFELETCKINRPNYDGSNLLGSNTCGVFHTNPTDVLKFELETCKTNRPNCDCSNLAGNNYDCLSSTIYNALTLTELYSSSEDNLLGGRNDIMLSEVVNEYGNHYSYLDKVCETTFVYTDNTENVADHNLCANWKGIMVGAIVNENSKFNANQNGTFEIIHTYNDNLENFTGFNVRAGIDNVMINTLNEYGRFKVHTCDDNHESVVIGVNVAGFNVAVGRNDLMVHTLNKEDSFNTLKNDTLNENGRFHTAQNGAFEVVHTYNDNNENVASFNVCAAKNYVMVSTLNKEGSLNTAQNGTLNEDGRYITA